MFCVDLTAEVRIRIAVFYCLSFSEFVISTNFTRSLVARYGFEGLSDSCVKKLTDYVIQPKSNRKPM